MAATTVVFNEGDSIDTRDKLNLLACAVCRTPKLDAFEEQILAHMTQHYDWVGGHEKAIGALRQVVGDLLQANPHDYRLQGLLRQISDHELTTSVNRRAYVTTGRVNPSAVWYPNPTNPQDPRSTFTELPYARLYNFIDKSTPIGSAGSCFAMEIAHRLQSEGYNYVITEPHVNPKNGLSNSCAKWGTIFNVPSMRQLIEKAFGLRTPPKILWSHHKDGKAEYRDPFREEITFESVEEYEASFEPHLQAVREALTQTKVFVMTLGVNEVWRLKSDGTVFSRNPWRLASSLVEHKVLTVEDNVRELQRMLDIWRAFNPDLKLIVTVSPVPLIATFRGDEHHVITATCHSKSTLRLAAEQFVAQNHDVYYFPSYETVMYCTENAWEPDQRHVTRQTVGKVMQLFDKMFVRTESAPAAAVPAAEPVAIPDKKSLNFLAHPDWQSEDDLAPTLSAYLSRFGPADDTSLVLWLPPESGRTTAEAEGLVLETIHALGHDPEHIPDMLILDGVRLAQRPQLLKEMQALVLTGGTAEAPTRALAPQHGVAILEATARDLGEFAAKVREVDELERLVPKLQEAALRAHPLYPHRDRLAIDFLEGYAGYLATGKTPHPGYVAMRNLFCLTNGQSNQLMGDLYAKVNPPVPFAGDGILNTLTRKRPGEILERVRQDGYFVFEERLSDEICDRLIAFARTRQAELMAPVPGAPARARYDAANPLAVKYRFTEQDLLTHPDVQRFIADPTVLGLAQEFLGCRPVCDLVTMWWSTAVSKVANSEVAQLYHFDMDRLNFLKFFVYLTDVTLENGPHRYIKGSNAPKALSLLRDGRISDEEIEGHYPPETHIDVLGPKGTVFIADTSGFHKGQALKSDDRLIFQVEYASSMFGAPYGSFSAESGPLTPEFARGLEQYPAVFERFRARS